MKLSNATKSKPGVNLVGLQDDDDWEAMPAYGFIGLIAKQIGVKELAYELQVSKQYMGQVLKGGKPNPIDRVKRICEIARARGAGHLIAPIVLHIIGDDFNGKGTSDQANAIAKFAQLVMGKDKING